MLFSFKQIVYNKSMEGIETFLGLFSQGLSSENSLLDAISLPSPNLAQSHNNQAGISSEVVPRHTCNVRDTYESRRAMRKRQSDQRYRERVKNHKMQMLTDLMNLKGENDALKKEKESLKEHNSSIIQTLADQGKEIDRLSSDVRQLKLENEKKDALVQTLSGLLADPMRLKNEKLKDENATLKKNVNVNNSSVPQLAEAMAQLRIENKALKVQNDALCGKIISEQEQ